MPILTQLQFPSQGTICLATSTSVAHSVNKPRENPIIALQLEQKNANPVPEAFQLNTFGFIMFYNVFIYVHTTWMSYTMVCWYALQKAI